MNRTSRISTICRKELIDTLRDRRTVIAMVVVPMVLYPFMMLGSLQAFEVQISTLVAAEYIIGVADEDTRRWLKRLLDSDPVRRLDIDAEPAEVIMERASDAERPTERPPRDNIGKEKARAAKTGVRHAPPPYQIVVVPDVSEAVRAGHVHVGVETRGPPPSLDAASSTSVSVAFDQSEIRSEIAAAGVQGVLERAAERILLNRLRDRGMARDFITPIAVATKNVASSQRMAGSTLGQIVPLILILMTIMGAIYPAIDLTAGERERGTLETLMAAPVPAVDLVMGKFAVVTIIGLMSAVLNLLSVGGTIYLGGLGSLLGGGEDFVFPIAALPWVFLLLVPLAVMFGAVLLAVCSFARSFKEAQNYVAPVMMAAMIPGVVGILPGSRLEGPIVVMPVANIVVLTRDLFMGDFDYTAIAIVSLSTCLYAAAAIAIATKLFGQEAVLFADSGSIKTIFQRRFFKPRPAPSAAVALLVLAIVYSLNFYLQNGLGQAGISSGMSFLASVAVILCVLFGVGPWLATMYMRADRTSTFQLHSPPTVAWVAALCFGCSTWILAPLWLQWQATWLPMDPAIQAQLNAQVGWINAANPWMLVFFLALVPALCEELFFRGFVLSGVRSSLNKSASIITVAIAFGLSHHLASRLAITFLLGIVLALLVVQFRSIFPAMLAHFMHNAVSTLSAHPRGLEPWLERHGYSVQDGASAPWIAVAVALAVAGLALCLFAAPSDRPTYRRETAEGEPDALISTDT